MKLLTAQIKRKLKKYPIGSQDGTPLGEHKVIVKFFGGSCCTWLVCEGQELEDGDWEFFGCVTLDGCVTEYGYFLLSDLEKIRFKPFGFGVEREQYSAPATVADEFPRYKKVI